MPGLVASPTPAATSPASRRRAVRDDAGRRLAAQRAEDLDHPRRVLHPPVRPVPHRPRRPSATAGSPTSSSRSTRPGVTVRGFGRLDGDEGFAEVFFDDVFVPDDLVLGGVDQGWGVAMATTGSERGLTLRSPGRFPAAARPARRPRDRAGRRRDRPAIRDARRAGVDGRRGLPAPDAADVTRIGRRASRRARSRASTRFWSELDVRLHETALASARATTPSSTDDGVDEGLPVRAVGPDLRRHQRDPAQRRSPSACSACRGSRPRCASPSPTTSSRSATRCATCSTKECPPAVCATRGRTPTAAAAAAWAALGEMGVLGALVPEADGGLGLTELDLVLLAEETGGSRCPSRSSSTCSSARRCVAPTDAGVRRRRGDRHRRATRSCPYARRRPTCARAARAASRARRRDRRDARAPRAVGRRQPAALSRSTATTAATGVARSTAELVAGVLAAATLGTAAQLVGLGRRMLDHDRRVRERAPAVRRADRLVPGVKHHLADVRIALEFARAARLPRRVLAGRRRPGRAARTSRWPRPRPPTPPTLAGRQALQCHGAIGYTVEYDLHLWMKRAWALAAAWGDAAWHRERVARAILRSP